jgi:hypothetical protein
MCKATITSRVDMQSRRYPFSRELEARSRPLRKPRRRAQRRRSSELQPPPRTTSWERSRSIDGDRSRAVLLPGRSDRPALYQGRARGASPGMDRRREGRGSQAESGSAESVRDRRPGVRRCPLPDDRATVASVSDHHLLPRVRRSESRPSSTKVPERSYFTPAGGDHLRLRGIPVLAPGVGGAALGGRPEREVLRLVDRRNGG